MILLKISNSSEVVASKIGRLLERFTPDALDQSKVEDVLIGKLIENLRAEGLSGEVAAVRGLDLKDGCIEMGSATKLRRHEHF
jgi:hypothetical protein